jgi:hypothetical protein
VTTFYINIFPDVHIHKKDYKICKQPVHIYLPLIVNEFRDISNLRLSVTEIITAKMLIAMVALAFTTHILGLQVQIPLQELIVLFCVSSLQWADPLS